MAAPPPDGGQHPKGTLAVVGIYGLLHLLGWLAFYYLLFTPRGAVTP